MPLQILLENLHSWLAASAAFGALRSVLCNFTLSENLRGQVYTALVLTILLYGSEVS